VKNKKKKCPKNTTRSNFGEIKKKQLGKTEKTPKINKDHQKTAVKKKRREHVKYK